MPTLGLSMIVRDAEADLARCLESVRGVVDEIVIGDTGSTDSSPEIARRFGARVVSVPWENDFARARNRALEEVRTDWVLSLDADEMLDPESPRVMPELLSRATIAGYKVPIRNYVLSLNQRVWDRAAQPNTSRLPAASRYPAYIEHENVRLFHRQAEIYFEGRVHETVGARVLGAGLKLGAANFVIHHFGFVADPETRSRKNHLYRELGREKIRERPQDAQAHFELGVEELDHFKNAAAARQCFERATQLNPRFQLGWVFSAVALLQLGQYQEALLKLRSAEESGSKSLLVFECKGDAYYNLGDSNRRGAVTGGQNNAAARPLRSIASWGWQKSAAGAWPTGLPICAAPSRASRSLANLTTPWCRPMFGWDVWKKRPRPPRPSWRPSSRNPSFSSAPPASVPASRTSIAQHASCRKVWSFFPKLRSCSKPSASWRRKPGLRKYPRVLEPQLQPREWCR